MILLDDVVEVAAAPHDNIVPPWILLAQQAQRQVAPTVAVVILRGHLGGCVATAFLKKACAASLLRSARSRKPRNPHPLAEFHVR